MIDYTLIRSKRSTVGITVKDGKVYVRSPYGVSNERIELFVSENMQWITSTLEARQKERECFSELLYYRKFAFRGYLLNGVPTDAKRLKIDGNKIFIPVNPAQPIKTMLKREYKKFAVLYLSSRAQELSSSTDLRFTDFKLTDARTKWGSCSSNGLLRLNWRLILLSDAISDYVIIHELCHTKQLNHSKEFWNLVGTILPDYKEKRRMLKQYGPLIDICR